MFGYLFLSALGLQPHFLTLSSLVFHVLQKFKFTLHFKFYWIIKERSRNFNPYFYLQPWIGSVHLSYTADASLEEELIGISSLGGGDFILCGLITFKICHIHSYGRAMITKTVHQLKLLQLSRFYDRSPTMARIITIYQKLKMKRSWYLQRKINFNVLINNQLGPVWRANISKMVGYLFLLVLDLQPSISTLSTLVFLLLQKFEFTLHFKLCCVIREWSRNFNPSSYLQPWIGSVH